MPSLNKQASAALCLYSELLAGRQAFVGLLLQAWCDKEPVNSA